MRALSLWTVAYLGLVIGPLAVLAASHGPVGDRAAAFAAALGHLGLGMAGAQLVLTARFPRVAAPFGIDLLYRLHRDLALLALLCMAAHAAWLWPPVDAAGVLALAAFALLVAVALGRRAIGFEYDRWRRSHAALAALGLGAAAWHAHAVGTLIDAPLARALWIALPLGWAALILWVRVLRPWRLARRPWRVAAVTPVGGDAVALELEPPPGVAFDYAPGQFAWLTLGRSPFAAAEHPFSLSSTPTRPGRIEFTIKALGDASRAAQTVAVGTPAFVDGPYGGFGVERLGAARGLVFVAGGVGLAPILGILRALADRGETRPLLLFAAARAAERAIHVASLAELAPRLALTTVPVLESPPPGWAGARGRVDRALLARHLPADLAGWHALLCGPTPMMRAVERDLAALGLPPARVHGELFDLG